VEGGVSAPGYTLDVRGITVQETPPFPAPRRESHRPLLLKEKRGKARFLPSGGWREGFLRHAFTLDGQVITVQDPTLPAL